MKDNLMALLAIVIIISIGCSDKIKKVKGKQEQLETSSLNFENDTDISKEEALKLIEKLHNKRLSFNTFENIKILAIRKDQKHPGCILLNYECTKNGKKMKIMRAISKVKGNYEITHTLTSMGWMKLSDGL